MMGRQQSQDELWAPALDLFSRIPDDHLLRRLERVLDLGFVRVEVAECYGRNGHTSVDPVVLMKMMLLLFLDDVPSERELMRIIPLRLDYLWFLGFGLSDEIPDHSVLSKARRRWGCGGFRATLCAQRRAVRGGRVGRWPQTARRCQPDCRRRFAQLGGPSGGAARSRQT